MTRATRATGWGHGWAVARAVCVRGLRRVMARPILIMPTLVMPVFFVVSFTGAFSALTRIEGYGTDNVYNWMAPYAALQGAVFAGVGGAASAADDLENGFFDRLLLTPGGRFPLLAGTIGYSGVRSLIPTTAVLVVSYFGGLTLPGGPVGLVSLYVATVGMAVVFCLIGLAIVYRMRTMRSMMIVQVLGFSLMFLSIGQVPIRFLDSWLHTAARVNPLTNVLRLARQGFIGDLAWSVTWPGLVAVAAMTLGAGFAAHRGLMKMAP